MFQQRSMGADDQLRLAEALLPAVLAAGRLEMDYFTSGCPVDHKADRSPVTIADQEAEVLILAALAACLPGVAVVAEEAFAAGDRCEIGDTFCLVDALDGTKQFISGHKEFTINIAVVSGGLPVFGLVYAPALDDLMFTAGEQVLRVAIAPHAVVASGTALSALGAHPIMARAPPAEGLVALQSRSRNLELSDRTLGDFQIAHQRQLGSSYKFCLIAAGEADLYAQLGDTREWDTAAGQAVLEAAGGAVATLSGQPLLYGKRGIDYLNPTFIASSRPLGELPRRAALDLD